MLSAGKLRNEIATTVSWPDRLRLHPQVLADLALGLGKDFLPGLLKREVRIVYADFGGSLGRHLDPHGAGTE